MKSSGEHRRGRSMGSAPPPAVVRPGEKDEDLALFHEMKRREKHNFLYPAPDDLDATLSSKFGGMGAPTKKPGTDLLTSESDKNDYDWLLTPPGTPLFPSLDQEAAALAVLSPALSNGSYSSASSASKSVKSSTYSPAESVKGSRGNPSPRRQLSTGSTTPNAISRSRSSPSTAPILTRPSTPTSTGGTRPSTPTSKSSTRPSTPNLKLTISHSSKSYSNVTTPTGTRPSTPTPRSSTPPVRPTTPGGRSSTPTSKPSTPTMRRSLSGGRTGITSPSPTTTRGGPSPKRSTSSSRGNSPSAKRITSVITSIAGMSSEAPPNLRTTMPERSSSMPERSSSNGKSNYSNGSRIGTESGHHNYNNMDESAQNRRRPRSPSIARSFSSSSSQEQRTSSQTSRGSVVSSYDDGLEVNRPSSMGSSRNSGNKWHATGHEELLNGKPSAYANRAAKSPITRKESSGYGGTPTKKSSDMVKRSVDAYQNSPTSAYRHLHSSGPASPFYSSRTNSLLLRAGVGMNTSLNTTSSNASSEHGTTVAADTEGSERDEDDLCSWDSYGRRASMSPRLQQADILVLDKDDEKTVPWQDSLFERANSHGPSSSHSQGSQSTLDAEVTGFYETDGIASLEMLEQLGVMGESYQLKKGSSFRGRSSERQTISTEDVKVPSFRTDDYGHSRISPHKVLHEPQRSPARHLAHLEKQESLDSPRRSRDFDSKIPTHSVFQENHGSPLRLLANLVRPEEVSERPRKSRDFESKSSPRRLSLESQGSSPARHIAQLEKQESLERPRRSRDFESKNSPRRLSLESQGSPARQLGQVEKQEILERPSPMRSRDFDFEAELLRRNGEKSLALQEPQAPNSEIRAACLFVRDFKVGVSPTRNLDSQGNSPAVKKLGIEEMEMKLRNDLAYDWDNSVEKMEQRMMDSNGDTERKYSDSPTLVSHSKKNVASPESTGRRSLDFLVIPTDTVHPTKIENNLVTPDISKEEDTIDTRKQELTLPKDVDLTHHILMNGTPTSMVIEDSFINDVMMDESETESTQPKEVAMDYQAPPESSQPSGMVHSMFDLQKAASQDSLLLTSQVPGIQSDLSDDGVYAMDEDTPEMLTEDGVTASQSEEESAVLEKYMEGGHVLVPENQHNSPIDVHEASVTVPEKHKEEDEMLLQAEIQQEAAHEEELDIVQPSEDYAASVNIYNGQHSAADHGQGVVKEELGMWYLEADHQKDVVERFLQAVPFSVGSDVSEVVEKELSFGEDERETILEEADGTHASERQVQQVVHSNGNYLNPNTESVAVLEKESICDHDMESVLENGMDNEGTQELPEHEHISAAVDVKESSPLDLHAYPDAIEENEESALHGSYDSTSVDHSQEDVLTSGAELEGSQDPVAEVVDIKAAKGVVKEASVCSSDHQMQESSSLEYFDADFTGDEVSSELSNHVLEEGLQSPKYSNSDSQKDLQHLSDPKEEKDFLEKDIPSLQSSQTHYLSDAKYFRQEDNPLFQTSQESPKEDIDLFHKKLSEFDSRSVKNQQLPNGSADCNKINSNCKLKAAQFVDKHPEVLDLSPSSEDISEVQPPKTEFRSASTLCAALEEQIAGLIQKIDSAIEESSKPFSASPQESLLVKDKRSILEPEQDDFTGSMRSSQEEDLLDMLWAEDDETSCSEGSRDQDILNSKDFSQREMNGVRSSRLSDRVLPVSLLGHSNEAYDAVVRSSRSDIGVEKRMLEGSSKRIGVSPVDQHDDVVLMHNREPMKSPVKTPMKSPLLWSKELKIENFGVHDSVPEDAHFHLEAQSNIEKSNGEGGQSNPDEGLRTESFGQEYSDSLTESSSYDDVDMKTDAELLSLCKVAEPVCDSETQAKSSAVSVSATPEAGPLEYEGSIREETVEGDASSLKESTQGPGESLEAAQRALPEEDVALENISHEMDMSDSIGNSVTPETRDQATQEFAQNRDTDESSILLTLAHSEVRSEVVNEVSNDEWLHRKSSLLEETSSTPVPSMGHVTEEHAMEFKEEVPQTLKEPEVLPEIWEDSSCPPLTSEPVDSSSEREEIQGKGNVLVDHFLRDPDIECVQESEGVQDIHPLPLSPHHEASLGQFSFGLGAVEEPESLDGRDIGDGAKVMRDSNWTSDSIVDLTQIPESNSSTNGNQHTETNAAAEVEGEDLFTSQSSSQGRRQWNLGSRNLVLEKFQTSSRGGAVDSRSRDEISSEGAAVVQEIRMVQESPESSPGALSNQSVEEVQIQKSESNWTYKDSSKGQHISLISGDKIRAEMESFRMEENDSGPELGGEHSSLLSGMADKTIARENMSTEAHVDDEVQPQESQTLKGEEIAEGPATEDHQEVTRLSVLSELPATNFKSRKNPAACKQEMNANDEDVGVSADGNGDLGTREVKDSRVGIQSVKRLPSSKAKSVRTISLSPRSRSQTESPSDEPGTPEEEVTPQKPSAYTNITVISPESLQWDRSSPVETLTKARSSPGSLSRNMTAAEATDTILFSSSLMNTIVSKAAASANEKEEHAALASTPTSNGEVPHNPDLSDVRVENYSEGGEAGNCKSQGVNTGPPSVRRALSYMGHQTVPLTPADTSLQIPPDQVIDVKALEAAAPTATEVNQKDEVIMPVKVSKSRCGCTIM